MWVGFLGQEDPLEKEMATHSSVLAWRIPGAGEPGGLLSMTRGLIPRVSDSASLGLSLIFCGLNKFPGDAS